MGRPPKPKEHLPGEAPFIVKTEGVRGRQLSEEMPPVPVESRWHDEPVVEDGKASTFTVPIDTIAPPAPPAPKLPQEMGRAKYDREAKSLHLGYAEFLKTRSFDSLKLALARHGSPRATKFLAALINPKFADIDIATLADRCGIGFAELMSVWRNDKLTEAMANLIDAAPTVAAHVAQDAESTEACCPRCDGGGMMKVVQRDIVSWIVCAHCKGTGVVRKAGDRASREMVMEATGLIKTKGGGVNVNINTGANSSVESVLEEMERVTTIETTAETL